jgi:3-deoxy-D-manno-octulosonic-acid transferase
MRWLYNLGIRGYYLLILISSLRNHKARKWLEGRRDIFSRLRETIKPDEPLLWFHASSLGEFEQGRPVIEAIRKKAPQYKILLTFFSPSGYELRKNYHTLIISFISPWIPEKTLPNLSGLFILKKLSLLNMSSGIIF